MRIPASRAALLAAFSLICPVGQALAQSDAGALLNQQQRGQPRLPQQLPPADAATTPLKLKGADGSPVALITLSAVHFSGATQLVPDAELQALVREALGLQIGFAGLQGLADRVTEFLQKTKGYPLARAILPRQDVTAGRLEIRLLEGRLDRGKPGTIVADPQTPPQVATERLESILNAHLKPGATVTQPLLERTVLLINDLPGTKAQAQLEAGEDADSTRVIVRVQGRPQASGSVSLDNYGNKDTGEVQASFNAQYNNPLRLGDSLAGGMLHTRGLDLQHLRYVVPLGSDGLTLGAALTHMDYRIIRGSGLAAGLTGNTLNANLILNYPLVRSRAVNVYGGLSFSGKRLVDKAAAGPLDDKRNNSGSVSLSGDRLDGLGGGGYNNWLLNWTQGSLDLARNAASAAADATGYQTQGSFNRINYGFSRLQKLPASFTVLASFSGQYSRKNLDSSEKFILGGPYGVRAYPSSEGLGDSGWLSTVEARYDLADRAAGQWQFVGFYDAGRITLHQDGKGIPIPTATGKNDYTLSGLGLGLNFSYRSTFVLRAGWASKLGSNPGRSVQGMDADGARDKSRLWLQATLYL